MTDTTPPFTVTREGDGLTADCGTGPRFFYVDEETDASLERIRDGVQAVLYYRAQERQAKAAADQEREAGVQALLDEIDLCQPGWNETNRIIRETVQALYEKGHRARPVDPDPELAALRARFPKGTRVDVAENVTFITGAPQRHLADTTVTVHEVARYGTDLLVSVRNRLGDGRTWVLPQYLSHATPEEHP